MKNFVNIRLPVMFACSLIAGIFVGNLVAYFNGDMFWALSIIPVTAVIFIVLLILHKYRPLVFSIVLIAAFSGGLLNSYFRLYNYGVSEAESDKSYLITATVKEKAQSSYGQYVILDGVKLDGKPIGGKIYARLTDTYGEFCDVAYTVEFYSKLTKYGTYPYGKLNYRAEDNVKYGCTVYGGMKSEYRFSLFGCIRTAIRDTLFDNVDSDVAAICYGMLIGDTDLMDDGALSSFRYGGIAHIFAVSGLHIGIIFLIVGLILKIFKPNKYVSAVIRIVIIIFYSGICGFTLSSIRAVIMCAVSLIAQLIYRKGDMLNSLSYATSLILIITPLSLFSVGLALITTKFTKLLNKLKVPNLVSSSAGTAVGAQLGTFPVMLANFGYVSGIGLFLNIIFVPVLSILFILLFGGTVLSLIIPVIAQYLMPVAVLPLSAVISLLINAGFENTLISGFGAGLFIPVYFLGLAVLSDKINLKILPRTVTFAILVLIAAIYCIVMTYTPISGFKIAVSANNFGGDVIIKSSNGTVLITTDGTCNSTFLNDNYSSSLDGVIILNGDDSVSGYDTALKCNDIYVYSLAFPAQPFGKTEVHYEKNFTLCGIDFEFIDGYSLTVTCDSVKVAVCANSEIPVESCDLLISAYENTTCTARRTVYFSLKDHRYNIYEFGELQFKAKNGKLFQNGIIPDRKTLY